MEKHYQAIIIGAGPSGTACGITLQQHGINHCILEKSVFPRQKTCAGLVTKKTYELIQELYDKQNIDTLFCDTSSRIKLYRKTELLTDAPLQRDIHLVKRKIFDNALVERYQDLGGVLRQGETGITIDYKNNRILLSDGQLLHYQTLIFADGALSISHKLLDVDKSKLAFGLETYLPASLFPTKSVDIYFDYLPNGYLWVFPHGDTVCIGIANQYQKGCDYKKILSDFLSDYGIDVSDIQYVGAFLPYGYAVPQEQLPDNVLLIGDAGGFTDPISGEGLYMALKTGICSAQSIMTDNPKKNYLQSVRPLTDIVKEGKKVQKIFYSPAIQKRILAKLSGKQKLVSFFFENQVEEYHYKYRQILQMYHDYKKDNH